VKASRDNILVVWGEENLRRGDMKVIEVQIKLVGVLERDVPG
jgi:hypothetical protein